MSPISKVLLSGIVALTAMTANAPVADAQVVVESPPSWYVATYSPFYYNGYAHYFYNNHWYYRDHGAWRGYDHEPAGLAGHRGEWASHRHRWR